MGEYPGAHNGALWGQIAQFHGLPSRAFVAAAGLLAVVLLTWRGRFQTGDDVDLTPSLHWQPSKYFVG